jgi:hypothetical protein
MAKVIKCECGYVARGETEVDLLVFTALWVVVLTGAVLIAALGANVLALTVLWLVVLAGAVLLVVAAYDDAGDDDTAAGAGVHAFVVTGVLTVLYLAAAGVALGGGMIAAFVGGGVGAVAWLLLRRRRHEHRAATTIVPS